VKIARSLQDRVPETYHVDLAEKVAWAGSSLYRHGLEEEAKQAFQLAEVLGPPRDFSGTHRIYQMLARTLGPYTAEQVSALYRSLFPQGLRARLPR
jgi:hypothetical protein